MEAFSGKMSDLEKELEETDSDSEVEECNNQDDVLSPEQKRNLPTSNDVVIKEEKVVIRHKQASHKLKKHAHIFGIESKTNASGYKVTPKSDKNLNRFKQEIKALTEYGMQIDGTYGRRELGECPAIHFYDEETKIDAIFKIETGEFITTMKLTKEQIEDLLNNKNVGRY